jgi:hypothetical protein
MKDCRRARRLRRHGLRLEAQLIDVYRDPNVSIGGQRAFRIACQAVHPANGRVHRFESEPMSVDPTDALGSRPVPVIVDPDDPSQFEVDLSGFVGPTSRP